MPLVLVERTMTDLRLGATESVLLLGNDSVFVMEASERIGARVPNDMVPVSGASLQEEAFRDFCLLARARRVLGGTSAFARVAQLVAGAKVVRPEDVLSAEETRALLWSAAMDGEQGLPLEATLASDHLFQRPDLSLSVGEEVALLERTIELDPEDPTRWFGLLVRLVGLGDVRAAERAIGGLSERFAGRETEAILQAARGRTNQNRPGHFTYEDWRALLVLDPLGPAWREALRAAA